jgi:hypothetical protein
VAFPDRSDERPHAPGDDPSWCETWSFDFATDAGAGGYVTLTLLPALRRAWYWAYLVGDGGEGPVAVIDDDVPAPRSARSLELRTEGLWADHTCETPLEHWTVANEAFAVRFDDPDEAYGRMLGDLVPLGYDLEWETDAPARDIGPEAYAFPCRVHGDVLVGSERLQIDGWGWREHRWGSFAAPAPRRRARLADGTWVWDDRAEAATVRHRAPILVRPPDREPIRVEQSLVELDGAGWGWTTTLPRYP